MSWNSGGRTKLQKKLERSNVEAQRESFGKLAMVEAISVMEGRWNVGNGFSVNVLIKRRSAIKEHLSSVFGSRKVEQFGGAEDGNKNASLQRRFTMRVTKGGHLRWLSGKVWEPSDKIL